MLARSGLIDIVRCSKTFEKPMSSHQELECDKIKYAFEQLDDFLLDLSGDVSESLFRIQSLDISKRVSSKGATMLLATYKELYDMITDPENLYEDPESLIRRSVFEVETLLSLSEE